MKKFLLAVATLLLCMSNIFAADREHTLKVYNWADYIDMNVLNGFPHGIMSKQANKWRCYTKLSTSTSPCSPKLR